MTAKSTKRSAPHAPEQAAATTPAPASPKKRKRVGSRAPKPIGTCDHCPRPFFKEEDKRYVPFTNIVICQECKETGKKGIGILGDIASAVVGHVRARAGKT